MARVTNLTDQQEKFVQELIKGKSQREAYKASYNAEKMKDKTIDEKASKLFKIDKIRARYNQLHDKIAKKAEDECIVTQLDVLRELKKIGFANITDYLEVKEIETEIGMQKGVNIFETSVIDKDKLGAISEIRQTKDGISIKLHDKVKALEDIGKTLGMFIDKIEHSGEMIYTVTPNNALSPEE